MAIRPLESRPEGLAIDVSERGSTTTIALTGEWDLAQQPATRDAIRRILERAPESVVLDLSRLSFIDSTGLHVVHDLHQLARHHNIRLVIVPGPRGVQRPFEICQLLDVLPFVGGTA
jgi:anti-anti-sigma factor